MKKLCFLKVRNTAVVHYVYEEFHFCQLRAVRFSSSVC